MMAGKVGNLEPIDRVGDTPLQDVQQPLQREDSHSSGDKIVTIHTNSIQQPQAQSDTSQPLSHHYQYPSSTEGANDAASVGGSSPLIPIVDERKVLIHREVDPTSSAAPTPAKPPQSSQRHTLQTHPSTPSRNRPSVSSKRSSRGSSTAGGHAASNIPLITYHINNEAEIKAGKFVTNFITTSKYTIITFLPLNLFNQLQRLANLYFVFVVILQAIPGVSPFPIYTSLAPLIFILAIGALNDGREDYYRHRADNVANSRPCLLVEGDGSEVEITSAVVKVGQIVRINQEQEFPADIILLHTSREDGACYVSTANLDGESAPKIRQANGITQSLYDTPLKLAKDLHGRIQYEQPNASLYRFQGNILLPDESTGSETLHPLGDKQLLLRGARLVNTEYIYGLVVYTGVETKMMLNRNPARFKFSHFEKQLNYCVIVCLLLNLLICLIPSFYYIGTDLDFARFWDINESDGKGWLLGFITLYILFSFMVPQSLYVTIELVKVGQALFMQWDHGMGWTNPDTGEYLRCQVKASALNEELAAVDVICTDKTGTLTSNQMDLSRCSIGGALFFENETHRKNHLLNHPQSDTHKAKHGSHLLMRDAVERAMRGWVKGKDEHGKLIFESKSDVNNSPSVASSSTSAASRHFDTPRQLTRDFFLNILLCNAVLPSWKAIETASVSGASITVTAPSSSSLDANVTNGIGQSPSPDVPAGSSLSPPATRPEDESDFTALESAPLKGLKSSVSSLSSHAGMRLVFESQSPDEIALLQALQRVGLSLVQRSGHNLTFDMTLGPQPNSPKSPSSTNSSPTNPLPAANSISSEPPISVTYTVLAQLEFASAWRRNSVIVRSPDGELTLYTKGADTTISQLIDTHDAHQQELLSLVMHQATQFAGTGSRTLVFACRHLTQAEYDAWYPIYNAAQNAFNDRDAQIERAFARIEQRMTLLGCSAVDDQMQELVPQTVDFLLKAEIQIIVLTGDKLETACQIAKDAHLIRHGSHVLYAAGITSDEVGQRLATIITEMEALQEAHERGPDRNRTYTMSMGDYDYQPRNRMMSIEEDIRPPEGVIVTPALPPDVLSSFTGTGASRLNGHASVSKELTGIQLDSVKPASIPIEDEPSKSELTFALCIDGVALELALLYHRPLFLQIFARVETVVSYRSTPMQKALVVRLMKETGKVCLAIGDGANDVSMIQESHVGIGILGKEGAHAAMSSDFVIQRFNHLRRLICVHGRNNYWRTSQVVLFSFYKNLAFPLPLFWYCYWSMANGTTSYDSLLITCFNTFFTSLPPFFAGLFDKDVSEDILMTSPEAFPAFKRQSPFTVKTFIYALVTGLYQSAVTYFIAFGMFYPNDVIHPDGSPGDMAVMGNMMITNVVITTNLTMLLSISSINYVNILATGIGWLLFMAVFIFEATSYQESLAPDGFGMGLPIFGTASSWLYFLLAVIVSLLPNAFYESFQKLYYPRFFQILQHTPVHVIKHRESAELFEIAKKRDADAKADARVKQALASEKAGRRKVVLAKLPGAVSNADTRPSHSLSQSIHTKATLPIEGEGIEMSSCPVQHSNLTEAVAVTTVTTKATRNNDSKRLEDEEKVEASAQ